MGKILLTTEIAFFGSVKIKTRAVPGLSFLSLVKSWLVNLALFTESIKIN
jgi:hypothetical protein